MLYVVSAQPHVLYLTSENELRDCLSLQQPGDVSSGSAPQSDAERHLADKLHSTELVQDYVKLSKRKQVRDVLPDASRGDI